MSHTRSGVRSALALAFTFVLTGGMSSPPSFAGTDVCSSTAHHVGDVLASRAPGNPLVTDVNGSADWSLTGHGHPKNFVGKFTTHWDVDGPHCPDMVYRLQLMTDTNGLVKGSVPLGWTTGSITVLDEDSQAVSSGTGTETETAEAGDSATSTVTIKPDSGAADRFDVTGTTSGYLPEGDSPSQPKNVKRCIGVRLTISRHNPDTREEVQEYRSSHRVCDGGDAGATSYR